MHLLWVQRQSRAAGISFTVNLSITSSWLKAVNSGEKQRNEPLRLTDALVGKVQGVPGFLFGIIVEARLFSINSNCKNVSHFLYRMKRMMMTTLKEVMMRRKVSAQVF